MKLGIIARSDKTGLGYQTLELTKMLNPYRILLVNSKYFNKNEQFPELYDGYDVIETKQGFPSDQEVSRFLDGLDVVISCETFYNSNLIGIAKKMGIKTMLQYNFEFLDNLKIANFPLPDVLIAPSLWNFDIVSDKFGNKCKVVYLPPPLQIEKFSSAKEHNMQKHNKVLHIAGKIADSDRNGTNTVIQMMRYSEQDYELVIKVQNPEKIDLPIRDSRITIDSSNPDNNTNLYLGFDAMVLPRRYAGLCLPMNEALASGLPVFMTNISPNNQLLPTDWLIQSKQIGRIKTRTLLPVYEANPRLLAESLDSYMKDINMARDKEKAFAIANQLFSYDALFDKYISLINE